MGRWGTGELLRYSPMESLFRNLKAEYIPSTGHLTEREAKRDISHCLIHRYHWADRISAMAAYHLPLSGIG